MPYSTLIKLGKSYRLSVPSNLASSLGLTDKAAVKVTVDDRGVVLESPNPSDFDSIRNLFVVGKCRNTTTLGFTVPKEHVKKEWINRKFRVEVEFVEPPYFRIRYSPA